jgi:hypothetical protein
LDCGSPLPLFHRQPCYHDHHRNRPTDPRRFGLRWQSGSGDTAFERAENFLTKENVGAHKSGVALRFPPQSKTLPFVPVNSRRGNGCEFFRT